MHVSRKPVERAAWAVLVVAVIGIIMPVVAQTVQSVGGFTSLV